MPPLRSLIFLTLHIVENTLSLTSSASQRHSVTVLPPKQFTIKSSDHKRSNNYHNKNAFYKDALRDRELFGFSSEPVVLSDHENKLRRMVNTHQALRPELTPLNRVLRPSYSSIKRSLNTPEKLDGYKKLKYTNLNRQPQQSPDKEFLDASRFDDDYDELIFIDSDEADKMTQYKTSKPRFMMNDRGQERQKGNRRMDTSSPKISSLKQSDSVVSQKIKNISKAIEMRKQKSKDLMKLKLLLKSTTLSPAELLYLSKIYKNISSINISLISVHQSKIRKQKALAQKRTAQLKARSISDNEEEESHQRPRYSQNSLHGHSLEGFYKDQHVGPVEYEQSQKMQFQIHGQQGPESYRFGHDTGNG